MIRPYQLAGSSARLALWVSCVAQLMIVLDISVVNVALPTIQEDLELGRVSTSWVAMAYSLGFAGVLLVGARLADLFGTARVLGWGIAAFTLASLVGGLASSGWLLVTARGVQGVAAAVASPATFTLLTRSFPEGQPRARAISIWTAVSLAGGGIGNITSGILTGLVSWRAVLLINLPIGVGVLLAVAALRHHLIDDRCDGRIHMVAALTATGGFACTAYALSVAGRANYATQAWAAGAAGAVCFAVLGAQQRRAAVRLVPSTLLRRAVILWGNLATALTAVCFQVGLWFFLTFRMQDQLGYGPIQAGLAFLPLTLSMLAINTWVTPRLLTAFEARTLITVGGALACAGLAWLALLTSDSFLMAIALPGLVIGAGGGLLNVPLATVVTTGITAQDAGAASGLMNTAKQFGGTIGLAAASIVVAEFGTDRAAFAFMALVLALVAGIAACAIGPAAPGPSARGERLPGGG